jgi:hypothetical protein
VSAALLGVMPSLPREQTIAPPSFLDDARAGLSYLWRSRIVRAITLGYFGVVAFNGIDDVALVFLATDALDAGESAVGLLLAAVGLGFSSATRCLPAAECPCR